MDEARRTSRHMFIYSFLLGIVLIPIFILRNAIVENGIASLLYFANFLIGVDIFFLAICLFYAFWGAFCGNSNRAWNNFVEDNERNSENFILKSQ